MDERRLPLGENGVEPQFAIPPKRIPLEESLAGIGRAQIEGGPQVGTVGPHPVHEPAYRGSPILNDFRRRRSAVSDRAVPRILLRSLDRFHVLPVEPADDGGDRMSATARVVGVGQTGKIGQSISVQSAAVSTQNLRHVSHVVGAELLPMYRKSVFIGLVRSDPAEMDKNQWRFIGAPTVRRLANGSAHQVPVRYVVSRMSQDIRTLDERRNEIHPLLFHEQTVAQILPAIEPRLPLPPFQQATPIGRVGQRQKPQIVRSIPQDRQVIQPLAVLLVRGTNMGRENGLRAAAEQSLDLLHPIQEVDIRIDINRGVASVFPKQEIETRRFYRGVEFGYVIAKSQFIEILHPDGFCFDNRKFFFFRIEGAVDAIAQDQAEIDIVMVLAQRLKKRPGVRNVILRANGKKTYLHRILRSIREWTIARAGNAAAPGGRGR